jgi:hypothetical protein
MLRGGQSFCEAAGRCALPTRTIFSKWANCKEKSTVCGFLPGAELLDLPKEAGIFNEQLFRVDSIDVTDNSGK